MKLISAILATIQSSYASSDNDSIVDIHSAGDVTDARYSSEGLLMTQRSVSVAPTDTEETLEVVAPVNPGFGHSLIDNVKSVVVSFGVYELVMSHPRFSGFLDEYAKWANLGSQRQAMGSFWKYEGEGLKKILSQTYFHTPEFVNGSLKQSLPGSGELRELIDFCKRYLNVLRHVDREISRCGPGGKSLSLYGPRELVDLSRFADLQNLVSINLAWTGIKDEELIQLSGLENLQYLDLRETQITDEGLAHIARLVNLRILFLYGTQVTEAAKNALKAARPGLRVR